MTLKKAIEALDDWAGAAFWSLDNGWRTGADEARVAGITCKIATSGKVVEVTAETVEEAIVGALAKSKERSK